MRQARLAGAVGAVALLLAAACGGASDGTLSDGDGTVAASVSESSGSGSDTAAEGASSDEHSEAPVSGESAAPAEAPVGISDDVPDLELIDVSTGGPVSLRSLVPSGTPLLFWFWAPH